MDYVPPSRRRTVAAVLLTPIPTSVFFAVYWASFLLVPEQAPYRTQIGLNVFLPSLVISELLSVAFGVPTALWLRKKLKPRLIWAVLFGGIVCVIPMLIMSLLAQLFPAATDASIDGRATIINGYTTFYGLYTAIYAPLTMVPWGMLAGVIFWVIIKLPWRLKRPQ